MKKLIIFMGLLLYVFSSAGEVRADVFAICDGCSVNEMQQHARNSANEIGLNGKIHVGSGTEKTVKSFQLVMLSGSISEEGLPGGISSGLNLAPIPISTPFFARQAFAQRWELEDEIRNFKIDLPVIGTVDPANDLDSIYDLVGNPINQQAIFNYVNYNVTGFQNKLLELWNNAALFYDWLVNPIEVVVNFPDGSHITLKPVAKNSLGETVYEIDWSRSRDANGNLLANDISGINVLTINEINNGVNNETGSAIISELLSLADSIGAVVDTIDNLNSNIPNGSSILKCKWEDRVGPDGVSEVVLKCTRRFY